MAWNRTTQPRETESAAPLLSVSAVIMDTETTGLDTAKDRIVQIGAVRIAKGKLQDTDAFDQLVNPGIAIPAASTTIHGITDKDVNSAGLFPDVFAQYESWAGNALLLGYSIGFDIAVIENEFARIGRTWTPPPCIDVRHLAQIAAPSRTDLEMEAVADWLGVEPGQRHYAVGDAITTARIFLALVPLLAKKEIFTLAQAERAVQELSNQLAEESRAGWYDTSAFSSSDKVFAAIDSFPYRHKIGDLMSTPPIRIAGSKTIKAALDAIMSKEVSSIFVESGAKNGAMGILTERDILRGLDKKGAKLLTDKVSAHSTAPLVSVGSQEFAYKAISLMTSRGFRHLGVHDDSGQIIGALSARDLLRQRSQDAYVLGQGIEDATSPEQLARIWPELTAVATGLVSEAVDGREVASIISRELRELTAKACIIAEQEMLENGKGEAPVPYTMLVLGSGGRGESLLAMDQDNAIIFEKGETGGDADKWFHALGQRVTDILNMVGVPYCTGGVMASNAEWRKDIAGWQGEINSWINQSKPQDIMNSDIFFDCRAVHGDTSLLHKVRPAALETAGGSANFIRLMAINAADIKSAFGFLGRWRLENGRVDLKRAGLMPIFSTARCLAIKFGSSSLSTPERFNDVRSHLGPEAHIIDNLIEAHRYILGAILGQQLVDIEAGIKLGNYVDPKHLSALQEKQLRWALEQVEAIPDLLNVPRNM